MDAMCCHRRHMVKNGLQFGETLAFRWPLCTHVSHVFHVKTGLAHAGEDTVDPLVHGAVLRQGAASSSSALLLPPSGHTMNWISTHLRVWTEPVKSADQFVLHVSGIQFITLCVATKFSLDLDLDGRFHHGFALKPCLNITPEKRQERKCFWKMDKRGENLLSLLHIDKNINFS